MNLISEMTSPRRGVSFQLAVGILIMTVLTVAIGRDKLMQAGPLLIVACVIHSTAGFGLGSAVCRLLKRDQLTCRTIALELGLQNSDIAQDWQKTSER